MRNIIVFQHVGHEPLGTLNPMLKDAGFRIKYINFGRNPETKPKLEGYNGLVILGGPMSVENAEKIPHLKTEMKAIEEALKRDIPVLGICLGSQLIAHVLGAQVRKAKEMEIGWYELHVTENGRQDPLLAHFAKGDKTFQLHEDTFDPPKTAEHLAFSTICEGQAFRFGNKVYGLQFHLEVDRAMIHRWLKVPSNIQLLREMQGQTNAEAIERETDLLITRNQELASQTFKKFIEIFQLPERPVLLGSDHAKSPNRRHGHD